MPRPAAAPPPLSPEEAPATAAAGKKAARPPRKYVPKLHSSAFGLLVTLYIEKAKGHNFLKKQELMDLTDKSGLSNEPMAGSAVNKAPTRFGQFKPQDFYGGWSSMKTLIKNILVVKYSNPAKYMLTDEGIRLAEECMSRSGKEELLAMVGSNPLNPLPEPAAPEPPKAAPNRNKRAGKATGGGPVPKAKKGKASNPQVPVMSPAGTGPGNRTEPPEAGPSQNNRAGNRASGGSAANTNYRNATNLHLPSQPPVVYNLDSDEDDVDIPPPRPYAPCSFSAGAERRGSERASQPGPSTSAPPQPSTSAPPRPPASMPPQRSTSAPSTSIPTQPSGSVPHQPSTSAHPPRPSTSAPPRPSTSAPPQPATSAGAGGAPAWYGANGFVRNPPSQPATANTSSSQQSRQGTPEAELGLRIPPLQAGEIFEMAYEVILVLDNREQFRRDNDGRHTRDRVTGNMMGRHSLQVVEKCLPVGDALWVARHRETREEYVLDMIVERKRVDDLVKSIKDSRYKAQKDCGIKKLVYLIQGDPLSAENVDMLKSADIRTELEGFHIQRAPNEHDVMRIYASLTSSLEDLYASESKSAMQLPPDQRPSRCRTFMEWKSFVKDKERLSVSGFFCIQLLQIRGIVEEMAHAIVEHYPTLHALTQAYLLLEPDMHAQEKLLSNIRYRNRTVGDVLSKKVYSVFWAP